MNLILFGAPGAGKGTQSALLVENFDMRHISTGDLFRKNMKDKTELSKKAKFYIDAGNLVPDGIVIKMVEDALDQLGGQEFILDGFPRTLEQAKALDEMLERKKLKIGKVVSLEVPQAVLVSRLTGRRVCKGCGAVYHISAKQPKVEGVCDVCNAVVAQRKDDSEEVAVNRLNVYKKSTQPVKDYYMSFERLEQLDGTGSTSEVFERIQNLLKN